VTPTFISTISGLQWGEGQVGDSVQLLSPLHFLERERRSRI
jgi:hypothetical protein